MWRFTGISDLQNLLKANVISTLVVLAAFIFINRFEGLSRSIFIMDGIFCFMFTAGTRIAIRIYYAQGNSDYKATTKFLFGFSRRNQSGKNTLLLGAGKAGEALLREINNNPSLNIMPIGFLDDSPDKKGLFLHGVPVLGSIDQLKLICDKFKIKQNIIAMPSASYDEMRRVVKHCDGAGITYKILPGLGGFIDGSVSIKDLRDVNYEDLLGREPVELDDNSISKYIEGNTLLVTGGGGSIGSELCRQIIKYHPKHLVILDNCEYNIFKIESELRRYSSYGRLTCLLGDIKDNVFLNNVFSKYTPKVLFHSAAYKHVHLVEEAPWMGVFNNVIGSKMLMENAIKHLVDRFVLVSTDKAVKPTNVMGACKRVTEFIAQSYKGNGTKFIAVRFGNVLGSSGSVVPYFRQQIMNGGPVTVTHKNATRYFMTIPEAAKLILQAGAIGEGGEIFVLKMGTPVNILEMAEDLIRLSGKEPYIDIDIIITGLRDGEKVNEELVSSDDVIMDTGHDKIMVLKPFNNGVDAIPDNICHEILMRNIEELHNAAKSHDPIAIKKSLKLLVKEYIPYNLE